MHRCFIGIGSNLDDPISQVNRAVATLSKAKFTHHLISSSLYRSHPLAGLDQPDYINAVVAFDTSLTAHELLSQLQNIENGQGRQRNTQRWSARTLDLDILVYGDKVINDKDLTVPHYGIHERNFVLLPLNEIAPDLLIPTLGIANELVTSIDTNTIDKLTN